MQFEDAFYLGDGLGILMRAMAGWHDEFALRAIHVRSVQVLRNLTAAFAAATSISAATTFGFRSATAAGFRVATAAGFRVATATGFRVGAPLRTLLTAGLGAATRTRGGLSVEAAHGILGRL
ncbi:MAG: hypothetical protein V4710_12870, partial [Verrucomicrobiota bacterium]